MTEVVVGVLVLWGAMLLVYVGACSLVTAVRAWQRRRWRRGGFR